MRVADWRKLPNEWTLAPPMQWLAVDPNNPTGPGYYRYCPDRTIRHPERIVQKALAGLGHETKGEGFHTLRRSAARIFHDLAAADPGTTTPAIRVAQALLGHKNQTTTEVYLGITVEKQARDDLLRGKSFLHRAVSGEAVVDDASRRSA
jgi:integrase